MHDRKHSRPADQTEQRQRRRASMPLAYDGAFDLAAEVAAITEPLAARVAATPQPLLFRSWVIELADAVHELVSTVAGWLAEPEAQRKTAHLAGDPSSRRKAVRTLCDLAQRPALPEITDGMLTSGSWAALLVSMAGPSVDPLAELLSRAWASAT